MYGVPDFYQNDNVKKGTGMQWRHQVVSDLPRQGMNCIDLIVDIEKEAVVLFMRKTISM